MARKGRSLVQSGGKASSFGGGKGGTKLSRGATAFRKIGSGVMNNGLRYNVRSNGGNLTLGGFRGRIGRPPKLNPGTNHATKTRKITVRRPEYRGGGR